MPPTHPDTLASVQPADADLSFTLSLGRADKRASPYRLVPFDVPEGVTRFEVRYAYPKSDACVIDLGVGDPGLDGFPSDRGMRGWSGGARDRFFLGVDAATPGYEAGPIQPGRWQVILGLYRLPEMPVPVRIEIRFSHEARSLRAPAPPPQPVRKQPGWYCGDLQCHTFHSDAFGAPEHLHRTALREGLDFLAVTDHNTVSQQAAYFDAASSQGLIFVPAYEFTTEFGHANVFGARQVFDFRAESSADVLAMVRRIRQSGALFSINHDKPTIPWSYDVPEVLDCMEVWQSHWLAGNHISLDRYQQRLAMGMRITAIGGSDFHQPAIEPANNPVTLARPTTFLWLEELSLAAILDALKAGRSFVTESPHGPRLMISAGEAHMGDAMTAGDAPLMVHVQGGDGDQIDLWDATGRIGGLAVTNDDWNAEIEVKRAMGFVRAELVADASQERIVGEITEFLKAGRYDHSEWAGSLDHPIRRAVTSPIYLT